MNKEIEETRAVKEKGKALNAYVNTIKQELCDRNLSFIIQVYDEKSNAFSGGWNGKHDILISLLMDIVGRLGGKVLSIRPKAKE